MAKLIMMKGLPGSGKSTKAKEMLKEYGNYVRVNRDDLRGMLHSGLEWSGKKEKHTIAAEKAIVSELLTKDVSVIVDDTNMLQSHRDMWSNIATEHNAKFEVHEMDTGFEECIVRDAERDNSVGPHVIASMALRAGVFPYRNLVICDIDGTIASIQHRLHYIKGSPRMETKDWGSFFERCTEDGFRYEIWDQVEAAAKEHDAVVVFLSGRSDVVREATVEWLKDYTKFVSPIVLMRPHWDHRPDTELKKQMFDQHFGGYNIVKVFDDRPRLIRMWREIGLDVVDCGTGEEF